MYDEVMPRRKTEMFCQSYVEDSTEQQKTEQQLQDLLFYHSSPCIGSIPNDILQTQNWVYKL
jgi:hypothetical protein